MGTSSMLAGRLLGARTVTFVGAAKNAGKTTALISAMHCLRESGRLVGLASIGRDGESVDVLNEAIVKPQLRPPKGAIVATTKRLLARGEGSFEVLVRTGEATALGELVLARALGGSVEITGPASLPGMARLRDRMIELGAEHMLVDGSIDRVATASRTLTDAVVLCTGAVLGPDVESIVRATARFARRFVHLGPADSEYSNASDSTTRLGRTTVVDSNGTSRRLPASTTLFTDTEELRNTLGDLVGPFVVHAQGAVTGRFVEALARLPSSRGSVIEVADATRWFAGSCSSRWMCAHDLKVAIRETIPVAYLTVNPIDPGFTQRLTDCEALVRRVAAEVPGIPVIDVVSGTYAEGQA